MKIKLTTAFILTAIVTAFAQEPLPAGWDEERGNHALRVSFYNIENLFDTIDHPRKRDEEYTPNAEKKWNSYKYRDKLNKVSKVIIAMGGWEAPAIVGLCEIENDTVLADLANTAALKKHGYQFVHFISPDRRGIDVALLYQANKFTPVYTENIKVALKDEPDFRTRDILYVKGFFNLDTLHIFVNHWPSRRGGSQQSEYKRINAASVLRAKLDSLYAAQPNTKVIIMGDFNDTPENKSIEETLMKDSNFGLHNLMESKPKSYGSHKYKGHWSYIDQIIISESLKNNTKQESAIVFWQEWMMEEDSKHPGFYPKRSWRGPFYHYGFSDHLPVFIDIIFDK